MNKKTARWFCKLNFFPYGIVGIGTTIHFCLLLLLLSFSVSWFFFSPICWTNSLLIFLKFDLFCFINFFAFFFSTVKCKKIFVGYLDCFLQEFTISLDKT